MTPFRFFVLFTVFLLPFQTSLPVGCMGAVHAATLPHFALTVAAQRQEPPPDLSCSRIAKGDKHVACSCHRACSDPDDPGRIVEESSCKVYCAPSRCTCPPTGCP